MVRTATPPGVTNINNLAEELKRTLELEVTLVMRDLELRGITEVSNEQIIKVSGDLRNSLAEAFIRRSGGGIVG